jgi:hypothetical protein
MATWRRFEEEAAELAAAVRAKLAATKHHVLATLRADGAPRVSGTEVRFERDGLYLGSMWQSAKALDLRRDGRFALHANPGDGSMTGGDAKVAGRAVEVLDETLKEGILDADGSPPGPFHLFHLDLTEVVLTSISADQRYLVIETWRPGAGVRKAQRA